MKELMIQRFGSELFCEDYALKLRSMTELFLYSKSSLVLSKYRQIVENKEQERKAKISSKAELVQASKILNKEAFEVRELLKRAQAVEI